MAAQCLPRSETSSGSADILTTRTPSTNHFVTANGARGGVGLELFGGTLPTTGLPGRVGQIRFNESRILRPTGRDAESAGGLPKAISCAFGLHQRQPSSTRSMAYPHFMLASSPQFDASYFTSSPASRRSQDVKRVAAHFC